MSDEKVCYFKAPGEKCTAMTISDKQADFFRHEADGPWVEIDAEEYTFITTHWIDDPEWLARYGTVELGTEDTSK